MLLFDMRGQHYDKSQETIVVGNQFLILVKRHFKIKEILDPNEEIASLVPSIAENLTLKGVSSHLENFESLSENCKLRERH